MLLPDLDFIIQRYRNGVKLGKPEENKENQTISAFFKARYTVYFLNQESKIQLINDAGLEIWDFDSSKKILNKNIFDLSSQEVAWDIIKVHREVMDTQRIKVSEHSMIRKDGFHFHYIKTIFPWYDDKNNIVGIFGCSISPEKHSLGTTLTEIANIGGFSLPSSSEKSNKINLSKREEQCIKLLIIGDTAKKIARKLNLSPRTIEHYLENIKNKFGVSSRYELIAKFLKTV